MEVFKNTSSKVGVVYTGFWRIKDNKKLISQLISEYPTRAKRLLNSRVSKGNLDNNGFKRLPKWEGVLLRYLKG